MPSLTSNDFFIGSKPTIKERNFDAYDVRLRCHPLEPSGGDSSYVAFMSLCIIGPSYFFVFVSQNFRMTYHVPTHIRQVVT
jgi:hypothetical protein